MGNGNRIRSNLSQVMRFQGQGNNSSERLNALKSIVADLKEYEQEFFGILADHGEIEIKCSSAVNAYCPWVLICAKKFGLKSEDGYFVDFLFGWDKKAYLVIIPRVDKLRNEIIAEKKRKAKEALEREGMESLNKIRDSIRLRAPGGYYPKKYELGIVAAEEIQPNGIGENEFMARIRKMLGGLKVVYDAIEEEKMRR